MTRIIYKLVGVNKTNLRYLPNTLRIAMEEKTRKNIRGKNKTEYGKDCEHAYNRQTSKTKKDQNT